jgi:hypothetical protein
MEMVVKNVTVSKEQIKSILVDILTQFSKSEQVFHFSCQTHDTSTDSRLNSNGDSFYFDFMGNRVSTLSFYDQVIYLDQLNEGTILLPEKAYLRFSQFYLKMKNVDDCNNQKRIIKVVQSLNEFHFFVYSGFIMNKPYSLTVKF